MKTNEPTPNELRGDLYRLLKDMGTTELDASLMAFNGEPIRAS